ncbi:hypothetical protein ACFQ4A_06695 [Lentibacillus salinarum]|uniref:Uncharacterized protein n=1 Tax=Lentibacillus salinarum TaxID=446820 RepID=A0ABW3ZT34_9BACI
MRINRKSGRINRRAAESIEESENQQKKWQNQQKSGRINRRE